MALTNSRMIILEECLYDKYKFFISVGKRRIKDEIAKKIMDKYNKKVVKYEFHHVGEEKVFLYVYLEDGKILFITAEYFDIAGSMTFCEDMSF